jgi:hypothetical protein
MQFQRLWIKSFGLGSIAIVGFLSYIQPGKVQAAPLDSAQDRILIARVSVSDAAAQVKSAIDSQPTLKPFKLAAVNEGNMIVLTGTVDYNTQKQFAESIARNTAPSFAIDNRITY